MLRPVSPPYGPPLRIRPPAGVRVPSPHSLPLRRGTRRPMGRDRPRRSHLDDSRRPHEIRPPPPRSPPATNPPPVGSGGEISGPQRFVFPSATGREISDATLSKLLREDGIPAVPHGYRSSFRDWAAELTDTPREICELALAHVNNDRVEAAYRRSYLFDHRRQLMHHWAPKHYSTANPGHPFNRRRAAVESASGGVDHCHHRHR